MAEHLSEQTGTKMLRRTDVISHLEREIRHQWEIYENSLESGHRNALRQALTRINVLRPMRTEIAALPTFVETAYASGDAIPNGVEFSERIRIACNMTDAPVGAEMAMMRLLADLRVPLDELQRNDDEEQRAFEREERAEVQP